MAKELSWICDVCQKRVAATDPEKIPAGWHRLVVGGVMMDCCSLKCAAAREEELAGDPAPPMKESVKVAKPSMESGK